MAVDIPAAFDLTRLTMQELEALLDGGPVVIMLPVGAVEPHGPHLSIYTDIVISQAASVEAAASLAKEGLVPLVAPAVPYGVTRCALSFKGAVHVDAPAVSAYVGGVVRGLLANGVSHVCLVNNHLEPDHIVAVAGALDGIPAGAASVACPVARRWARTLSDEFRSGACHAGMYETSIVMAAAPDLVRDDERRTLPEVAVSLSDNLRAGVTDFREMGMKRSYAGAPAGASAAHGREQIAKLARMIVTEILEAMDESGAGDV